MIPMIDVMTDRFIFQDLFNNRVVNYRDGLILRVVDINLNSISSGRLD